MKIEDLLPRAAAQLSHLTHPRLEAELLLAHLLKVNRTRFIAFPEERITPEQLEAFKNIVERRKAGEPLAYITGIKEFYGLTLEVTPDTLIPRDDTEIIVEAAFAKIEQIREKIEASSPLSLLDLGTGSGAIALAVKKHFPDITMTAVDLHPKTLAIAEKNAKNNNLQIEFIESDWFSALGERRFDIILSNPPYIDPIDPHLTGDGVKFEPTRALIADQKGLADLYHIIEIAPRYFKGGGWLLLEHGYDQKSALQEKMLNIGYRHIETLKDYGGNDRVTLGYYSP